MERVRAAPTPARREGNGRRSPPLSWAVFSNLPVIKTQAKWVLGFFFPPEKITLVRYHLISLRSLACFRAAEVPLALPGLGIQLFPSSLHQQTINNWSKVSQTSACIRETLREPQVGGMLTAKGIFPLGQLIPEGFSQPVSRHFGTNFPLLNPQCLNVDFMSGPASVY